MSCCEQYTLCNRLQTSTVPARDSGRGLGCRGQTASPARFQAHGDAAGADMRPDRGPQTPAELTYQTIQRLPPTMLPGDDELSSPDVPQASGTAFPRQRPGGHSLNAYRSAAARSRRPHSITYTPGTGCLTRVPRPARHRPWGPTAPVRRSPSDIIEEFSLGLRRQGRRLLRRVQRASAPIARQGRGAERLVGPVT